MPGVSLNKTGAYDPHNVLLWWLLAAGIPGLVGALIATALSLERLLAAFEASGHQPAVIALVGGIVAWGVSVLLTWVIDRAAHGGCLVGDVVRVRRSRHRNPSRRRRAGFARPRAWGVLLSYGPVVLATLAAVSLVAIFPKDISAEYSWARAVDSGAGYTATARAAASRSHDPSLSALAAKALVQEAARVGADGAQLLSAADKLTDTLERDSVWHVDAAFGALPARLGAFEHARRTRGMG